LTQIEHKARKIEVEMREDGKNKNLKFWKKIFQFFTVFFTTYKKSEEYIHVP